MFKKMFENVTLPMMVIDGEGQILLANKGTEGLFGYKRQELRGRSLADLCTPYERSRYLFSNLSKIHETLEIDMDLRRNDGSIFMSNISFSPFRVGEALYLLVLRDVTTRRVQEEQLREKEERYRKLLHDRNQLEEQLVRSSKLACLGEISAGIAHEINNPLGIILGFAQDILEEIPEDHPLFDSIRIIEQETARCVDVVKTLLDYARLTPPQVEDVDIVQLIENSISLLRPKINKNRISIKRHYDGDGVPPLRVDPQLIRQALLNVMINAIQSMPYGGELAIGIERATDPKNSDTGSPMARITVSDTGIGIMPEHLGRVFDPFFSTKGSKGTGLGLSVSQRIIEDHCGKIEIQSIEGMGTTCTVCLPIP